MRVHRSFLVNRAYVKSARHRGNGEYEITLANGDVVMSSRTYRDAIGGELDSALRD